MVEMLLQNPSPDFESLEKVSRKEKQPIQPFFPEAREIGLKKGVE